MQSVIYYYYFVYSGQLLNPYYQAEPATVYNQTIKTRQNNHFCFYSKYLHTYFNCCKICMQKKKLKFKIDPQIWKIYLKNVIRQYWKLNCGNYHLLRQILSRITSLKILHFLSLLLKNCKAQSTSVINLNTYLQNYQMTGLFFFWLDWFIIKCRSKQIYLTVKWRQYPTKTLKK